MGVGKKGCMSPLFLSLPDHVASHPPNTGCPHRRGGWGFGVPEDRLPSRCVGWAFGFGKSLGFGRRPWGRQSECVGRTESNAYVLRGGVLLKPVEKYQDSPPPNMSVSARSEAAA